MLEIMQQFASLKCSNIHNNKTTITNTPENAPYTYAAKITPLPVQTPLCTTPDIPKIYTSINRRLAQNRRNCIVYISGNEWHNRVRSDLEIFTGAPLILESEARGVLVASDRRYDVVKVGWDIGAGAVRSLKLSALSFHVVVYASLNGISWVLASGHVRRGGDSEGSEAESGEDGELHFDGWIGWNWGRSDKLLA
jgi:hypothetical protein